MILTLFPHDRTSEGIMNRLRILPAVMAIVLAIHAQPVRAQTESAAHPPDPTIALQLVEFASDQPGHPRVDLYIQIPYNELMFVTDAGAYRAQFELSAEIRGSDGQLAWQRSQSSELHANTFTQTVSDRLSSLRQFSANLAPGAYDVRIEMTDGESKRTETVKRRVTVRDLDTNALEVSDILLVNRVSNDAGRTSIVPNISGILPPKAAQFSLFFEVYCRVPIDTLGMTYRIFDGGGKQIATIDRSIASAGPMTQIICRFDSVVVSTGDYRVTVDVAPLHPRDGRLLHAGATCRLAVSTGAIPRTIKDVDKAIVQLRYVAKDSEIEFMQAGTTTEERQARFLEYWKKRDPDPSTPENELMEEYYARVAYANEHFRHFQEGWKTDMGMIFIRFGPPENVERHPFETDSRPYELWYYYQLNRQFVFVDRSGFGDYRLVYPTTDLWGRAN
jgi:GWxTD domain-containing protein